MHELSGARPGWILKQKSCRPVHSSARPDVFTLRRTVYSRGRGNHRSFRVFRGEIDLRFRDRAWARQNIVAAAVIIFIIIFIWCTQNEVKTRAAYVVKIITSRYYKVDRSRQFFSPQSRENHRWFRYARSKKFAPHARIPGESLGMTYAKDSFAARCGIQRCSRPMHYGECDIHLTSRSYGRCISRPMSKTMENNGAARENLENACYMRVTCNKITTGKNIYFQLINIILT